MGDFYIGRKRNLISQSQLVTRDLRASSWPPESDLLKRFAGSGLMLADAGGIVTALWEFNLLEIVVHR